MTGIVNYTPLTAKYSLDHQCIDKLKTLQVGFYIVLQLMGLSVGNMLWNNQMPGHTCIVRKVPFVIPT